MSKLSEKFAAGKKALADRQEVAAKESAKSTTAEPSPFASLVRAPGPLHGSVSVMKIDLLKSEVEKLRAAKPELKIPPTEVRGSAWANRHKDSFNSPEFEALKAEISSAGGNIQPIKVRPILNPTDGFKYEIIFGHRRHQACLQLDIDVAVIIDQLDDKDLFIEMDRENRQREDLRPYEQGVMYVRALDHGLFPSLRKLAEEVGADSTNVSRCVSLARFPDPILDAFESRLDIQYRWAPVLKMALEKDPDIVLARASEIIRNRAAGQSISSQAAYNALIGKEVKSAGNKKTRLIKVGSRVLSIAEHDNKILFELDKLSSDKLLKIEKFIADLMI